jgi:2-polyprenyl-6-methoxyphenol hydroxylase-like FAD-dependent oxidoreductase
VLADGTAVRAAYVVGCDGGRSAVRKLAGIGFPGTDATMTGRTAQAKLADPGQVPSTLRSPNGVVNHSLVAGEIATIEFDGGPGDRDTPVTVEELQASIRRASGVEATVTWVGAATRYSDNTRLAETYRKGRVLLAGDAAHVHSPIGGQGLNLGLQDAMNLGWKLGLVALALAEPDLLDTYTAERHPVAERVLRFTRAQVALMRPGAQVDALRSVLGEVIALPSARRLFSDAANGTDISYVISHVISHVREPAVGRFAPPQVLERCVAALRSGRPVLVNGEATVTDRVDLVALDEQPGALLVRPDGYVAWAGERGDGAGPAAVLGSWLGATVPETV